VFEWNRPFGRLFEWNRRRQVVRLELTRDTLVRAKLVVETTLYRNGPSRDRFESRPSRSLVRGWVVAVEWKRRGHVRLDSKWGRVDPLPPSFRVETADSGGWGGGVWSCL
jgi:hypothetical protein